MPEAESTLPSTHKADSHAEFLLAGLALQYIWRNPQIMAGSSRQRLANAALHQPVVLYIPHHDQLNAENAKSGRYERSIPGSSLITWRKCCLHPKAVLE
jgi:hypothetical protein